MATFNDLPIELVRRIWSFLERDPAGKRHLCTAVVPDVRRHNFRSTRIVSHQQLRRFGALVERRDPFLSCPAAGVKGVGACVRQLTLPRVKIYDGCDQDLSRKALVLVRRILRYCSEVEQLTCRNIGPMRVLLSLHAPPFLHLSKLSMLNLTSVEAELGTPLSQGHFVRLRRFPALRNLSIDLEEEDDEREAFGTVLKARPRGSGLSPVTNLSLCAGEALATSAAALFIADFAQLTRLELNLRGGVELGSFLQACPVTLKALTIHYIDELLDDEEEVEPVNVEAVLARFVHLQELTLGKGTFSPTCELFPILTLYNPRLRTLTLEAGTKLVADKLLNFVLARGGPSRLLEKVVLDSVEAHLWPLPSLFPNRSDVANGTFRFRRIWILPKWTPAFSLADAHEVIAAAKRVGVELRGSTVRAVGYDVVRAREEAYLQTRGDQILYSLRRLFKEVGG